jgi:4-hydroxy-tetrahydrodipicolinate synthase
MKLEGTYTALVTPFRHDGSLDLASLERLVEWQIESGVDGLVPCGSTGEAATLSHAEHRSVVRRVVEVAAKRVLVIAGTGSNSTQEAIELTVDARRAGADAALLISPYYNRPTQEGIFHHYRSVAEQSGLPILAYNIPGRTASRIEPETAARLSRVPGVAGTKESGGDLTLAAETLRLAAPGFVMLSGDDSLTLPLLAIGAHGAVTTAGNVAPREVAELVRAGLRGDFAEARRIHYRLLPLMEVLFVESNPIPVKTALALVGRIDEPTLRLPLTPIGKANRDRLEAVLHELELL